MSRDDGKAEALHLATYSGWYRFEQHDQQWTQTDRALTFWKMSSLQVDPENPRHVYIATEHSGLFITDNGGTDWKRAKPNVPRLTTTSLLALPGTILAGTVPAALYSASNGSGWQELEGVRLGATGGSFPPSPELGARTRFLASDNETPHRLYAAIEVGGLLVSDDAGQRWSAATKGLDDPDVHQVLPSAKTKDSLSPPVVKAPIAARIAGNIGKMLRRQEIALSVPRSRKTTAATIYLAMALGRPNTWLRKERADAALFVSKDGGAHWDIAIERLPGGIMAMCPAFGEQGVFASTSEGDVVHVDPSGSRTIISGLPSITAIALGA